MDPTKGSSNGAYGPNPPQYNPDFPQNNSEPPPYNPNFPQYNPNLPHYNPNPPPYNPHGFNGNGSNAAVSYENQDGKVHIPVVFPDDRPQEIAAVDPESSFSDAAIRRGFIRKVYLTLMIQLLVTFGIICAFIYWKDLRIWTFDNSWFSFTMIAVTMVLVLVLSCCGDIRRRVPLNFIALGLFTVAEGLMLGSLAAYYEAEAVMWAVGATALVSLSLTLFALQSKWDFTAARGSLWVFGWTLFSFALLCAILRSQYLYILYACLGTLLFSLYLVFDTQLILGGKHKRYQMSPEEYVFAALSLYLDIVTLFLLLLQLIGLCRA